MLHVPRQLVTLNLFQGLPDCSLQAAGTNSMLFEVFRQDHLELIDKSRL